MKKIPVVLIVMTLCLGFSSNLFPNGFGIKGGVKLPNDTGIEERPHEVCPIIGVFYRFDISDRVSIQPEILYFRELITIYQNLGTIKMDFLEIPLLWKFKSWTKRKLKFNLFIGPLLVFQFGEKWRGEKKHKVPMEKYFGTTFGAGLDIKIGSGCLVLDARSNLVIFKTWDDEFFIFSNYNRPSFTFMIGYAFK